VPATSSQLTKKEYLSTRQIFFIDQLTAVSAAHFDANIAVQNLLHGKLCAIFMEHPVENASCSCICIQSALFSIVQPTSAFIA